MPGKFTNEGIVKYFFQDSIQTTILEKKAAGSGLFDIEGQIFGLNYVNEEGEVSAVPITNIRKFDNL